MKVWAPHESNFSNIRPQGLITTQNALTALVASRYQRNGELEFYHKLCCILKYLILSWNLWHILEYNLLKMQTAETLRFEFVTYLQLTQFITMLQMTLLKSLSVHLQVTHCAGFVTTIDALQKAHGSSSSCQILTSKKLMIQMRRLFQIAPQINSKYMSARLLACFWIVMIGLLLF